MNQASQSFLHARLAQAPALLADAGWCVIDDWVDHDIWHALSESCDTYAARGELEQAAIGRGPGRAREPSLRGDLTRWLDASQPAEAVFLTQLDALRTLLNRALYLGLETSEAHFALYPPGAGYVRHRDRFRDDDARVVSAVCYLNHGWLPGHGGALRLHLPPGPHDVLPLGGRLVLFLSAEVEHEVLPATRERRSIAAWLRRR